MRFAMIHKLGIVISCLLLVPGLVCPGSALAQSKAYRIGPRDVLTLTIYAGGEMEREVHLTVSANGRLNVPFIGSTKAEGLTPSELEKKIIKPLAADYFVDPKVNVSIKEYHSLHYYISGAVKKPGLYETSTEASLLELIAKAGGVVAGRANVAYVMRSPSEGVKKNGDPMKVDLRKLLDRGDMSGNLSLEPGDVIYIPLQESFDLAQSKVYVEGEVRSPGIYKYQPGITAMNACIMAGGFDEFAAPNRTRIIRQKGDKVEVIKINLKDVKDGKIPDVQLKPGDRIHVPESWL
ncbi:MAG: polysaccharide biosynthesis/export family protein [Deltaproteobacteria bacterium]|nr:polysaccharide biosynthesis/export family protein [Deltaproteobacteria bacterium]